MALLPHQVKAMLKNGIRDHVGLERPLKTMTIRNNDTSEGEQSTQADQDDYTESGDRIGNGNDARLAALNAIVENYELEAGYITSAGDGETDPPLDAQGDTAPVESATQTEGEFVTLKIDGEERQISLAEVIEHGKKAMQMDLAADKRLDEAKRILADAKTQKNSDVVHHQQDVRSDSLPTDQPDEAFLKDIVNKIQVGDEADAVGALKALMGKMAPKPDQVEGQILARLAFEEGTKWLRSAENKDINDDPMFRDLFVRRESEARKQGDNRPHMELYRDIVSQLRTWKASFAPAATDDGGMKQRLERKQATAQPAVERAAAKAPSHDMEDVAPEDDPNNARNWVAEQRKRRGQSTY